jgi:hypothetical protein
MRVSVGAPAEKPLVLDKKRKRKTRFSTKAG